MAEETEVAVEGEEVAGEAEGGVAERRDGAGKRTLAIWNGRSWKQDICREDRGRCPSLREKRV